MAVTRREQFAGLLAPGLRKVFFDQFRDHPEEYSKVFNTTTSEKAYEEDLKVTPLGAMQEKPEGTNFVYERPDQGNKVRYTHIPFGKGFRITHEMWKDDLYGVMKKMSKGLGRAARNRVEVSAFDVFNDAFTGALYTGYDSLSLINSAHTTVDAGTISNTTAAPADISVASLQEAINHFNLLVDDRGFPILMRPKYILHHPKDFWIVNETLKSQYLPGAANAGRNDVNVLADSGMVPIMAHYLTDDDAAFVLADKGDHDLWFFWREKVMFDDYDHPDSKDAMYTAYMRFSVGFGEWRGVFGIPGA